MVRLLMVMSLVLGGLGLQPMAKKAVVAPVVTAPADAPAYTAEGQLKFPDDYREWVFLTSGLDMSYAPNAAAAKHSVFNNVFVNPTAYKVFVKTGTWPEGSMFMLENRGAEGNHSINTRGQTQAVEVTGTELHVKDSAHGGWAFYIFKDKTSAKAIDKTASCYSCHEQHAAVDTTFVQFYPTLLGVAKEKGVFSKEYLKEMETPAAAAK
ncbi:hypothetical protein BH10ACI4_BH10ACI4_15370 [soil metagenome]